MEISLVFNVATLYEYHEGLEKVEIVEKELARDWKNKLQ
jgi:hypothetical protein